MGILDTLKGALLGQSPDEMDFDRVIQESRDEYAKTNGYFWSVKISALPTYKNEVSTWSDKKRIDFIIDCVGNISAYNEKNKSWSTGESGYQKNAIRESYVAQLFKSKLIMDDDDLERLITSFSKNKHKDWADISVWPIASLLNQVDQQTKAQVPSPEMIATLHELRTEVQKMGDHKEKEKLKLTDKIDSILFKSTGQEGDVKPTLFLGEDDFSAYANHAIEALPAPEKKIWYQLIIKAQKATGSKPSKKYLDETKVLFKELGTDKFKAVVNDWFVFIIALKEKLQEHTSGYAGNTYTYTTSELISAINLDPIKGFVWMCSHFHDTRTIHTIADLAERSYRKIPGKGPAAAAVGNACLFTLYSSRGLDGIGQLSRLKLRIKQSSTQDIIEKYLLAAASEQGVSLHEIEDLAVDDHDLAEGKKEMLFDEYKAILEITGVGKSEMKWFKPDGAEQKAVPVFVKEKYAARLKKLKDTQKQVDQTTSAQRDRIDRMLRSDRRWTMENFTRLYLEHGLMSFLARKIIWVFEHQGLSQSAIYIGDQWVNNNDELIVPHESAEISLWHPAVQSVAEIKKWRSFLVDHKIQQPLKQAFREVYLLTDAEANTKSYSNRMAAHVLKQHQFNMLAKTRGWKYSLLGAFDNGINNQSAEVKLNEYGLRAEYWINELNADGATNDTGIWNYITTDQVRFIKQENNETVDLIDVPPIPFSEVLRDVDLFVGVASVGNDPTWQDSGGVPAYRDYWTSYSFGDLSETAKNRKDILAGLVPRLKINKIAEVVDKFLVVKGKLRTYKIHIGSTNILMEPNDQYLCIVPDRSKKDHTENLFIPFEGDAGLSIILSKAFLLADDDKITDTTITSQINRK
ncbi:MAG: hypothetical protein JWO03_3042 [Bacteroidetes bacterium]|nr:hypothetical protein [Bacteroidota bacterium]